MKSWKKPLFNWYTLAACGISAILYGPAVGWYFIKGGGPAPDTTLVQVISYLFVFGVFAAVTVGVVLLCFTLVFIGERG